MIRRAAILCAALAALAAFPASAAASFGFIPGSLSVRAEEEDGTIDAQAGSHPYAFRLHFDFNEAGGKIDGGEARDVIFDFPPGIVGNPRALPVCSRVSFEGVPIPNCESSTQVGVVKAVLPGIGEARGPLYNIAPPPGVAAQFGFSSTGLVVAPAASLRGESDFGVRAIANSLPVEFTSATVTIWGNPADPTHDFERGHKKGGEESDSPELAFWTLPTVCGEAPQFTVSADSKLAPGAFVSETAPLSGPGGQAQPLSGCEAVPFSPSALAATTTSAAGSPSGLDFSLTLPNEGLLAPKGVSETEPEKLLFSLPAGITANPAVASGLGACTPAQIGLLSAVGQRPARFDEAPPACPSSSKLGTLVARTPLLDEAAEGSVYLATPHQNPFASLLAVYIVAEVPARGVLVKLAGEVQLDPVTGQLTTSAEGLPPLPYSDLQLHLREGARAPLITPTACGAYNATARLYPFSGGGSSFVEQTIPLTISSGAEGGACVSSEAQLPNAPTLVAGSTAPLAGAYAPFVFKLSRPDRSQRFAEILATPPPGLTGKLAGIPYCPAAAIAAARARSNEGDGALELTSPSCPAASRVGTVTAGAGAGPSPYYTQGAVYLAGPYQGASLSFVTIAPAIAGPFDLGVVVVRLGLYLNEETAQITVKGDPLPQSLQGIPLDIRSVAVDLDRDGFALNPTNCQTLAVGASVISLSGQAASLQRPFRVGGCRDLAFKPKLALSLKGATRRDGHPALKAVLTQPAGQANLARTSVALPPSEFIDNAHIGNPCTRPQFAAEKCPAISLLGKARAYSPLLEKPLEGNVYFRSNGGARELPDVVADLRGQVHLVVVGFVDAIHKKGSEASRIRTTFATVPDAPVSKVVIELKGGKEHGLLVNSANICKVPNRAIAQMAGQNGKRLDFKPTIATSCAKK
jgi:hypothetical protein